MQTVQDVPDQYTFQKKSFVFAIQQNRKFFPSPRSIKIPIPADSTQVRSNLVEKTDPKGFKNL